MKIYSLNKELELKLKSEETEVIAVGFGNSMTPIIQSGQHVVISSLKKDIDSIKKGDSVFCKVHGRFYLHRVYDINREQYQIGNTHGKINGWTDKYNIFGVVIK